MLDNLSKLIYCVFLSITIFMVSCIEAQNRYKFPEKTVINTIDYSCLNVTDQLFIRASAIDEQVLNALNSAKIDSIEINFGATALAEMHKQYRFIEDHRTDRIRNILIKMRPFTDRKLLNYSVLSKALYLKYHCPTKTVWINLNTFQLV